MQGGTAPSFVAGSDCSLLVSFGHEISLNVHRRVAAFARSLETDPLAGVLNIHPAYCSALLVFDPLKTDHEAVQAQALKRFGALAPARPEDTGRVELPVCYGGEYGPDLDVLAQQLSLAPERIIALHSSAEYVAYFVGFVPGFAYLGGLPKEIEAPRLSSPRHKVPAGSVGIAGAQTGVYPFETPGGWRLIGRTPLKMFEAGRDPMSLIALGDRVKFVPITADEYGRLGDPG